MKTLKSLFRINKTLTIGSGRSQANGSAPSREVVCLYWSNGAGTSMLYADTDEVRAFAISLIEKAAEVDAKNVALKAVA